MSWNSIVGRGGHTENANIRSFWPLQDDATGASGVDVVDVSSNGNDMTLGGGDETADLSVAGPNDYLTKALSFDGSSDYAQADIADLGDYTILAWMDAADTTGIKVALCVSDSGETNKQGFIGHYDSENTFAERSGSFLAPTGNAASTGWIHLAGVRDNNVLRVYEGGSLIDSDTITPHFIDFDSADIGRLGDSTPTYYEQDVAGVMLFDDALTAGEVAELADGPEPVNTVAPELSGTETEGETLTSTSGTWGLDLPWGSGSETNGTPTYSYQWTRSDDGTGTGEADIGGAESSTYTLTASDVGKYIRCRVRANNDGDYDADADTNSDFTGAIAASSGSTGTVTEGATASDSISALVGRQATITEGASASDSVDGKAGLLATISEGIEGSDSLNGLAGLTSTLTEGIEGSDSVISTAGLLATVTEGAEGSDSVASALAGEASISEGIVGSDSIDGSAGLLASVSESAIASDSVVGTSSLLATITEGAVASDSIIAAGGFPAAITEGASASDSIAAAAGVLATIDEGAILSDATAALASLVATVTEGVVGSDSISAQASLLATITESAVVSDSIVVYVPISVEGILTVDMWSVVTRTVEVTSKQPRTLEMSDACDNEYIIDNEVEVYGKFRINRQYYNPTVVKADVFEPGHNGTPTTTLTYPTGDSDHSWSRPSTGVYKLTLENVDIEGDWTVVFYDPTDGERIKNRHVFTVEDVV